VTQELLPLSISVTHPVAFAGLVLLISLSLALFNFNFSQGKKLDWVLPKMTSQMMLQKLNCFSPFAMSGLESKSGKALSQN